MSLKAMMKAIRGDGEVVLLELCSLVSSQQQQNESPVPELIALLLQSYSNVFEKPKLLPLSQARDHAIVLQPGTTLVNVCPYRYPHHQKFDIEHLVRDMLSAGIIRPSVSPF